MYVYVCFSLASIVMHSFRRGEGQGCAASDNYLPYGYIRFYNVEAGLLAQRYRLHSAEESQPQHMDQQIWLLVLADRLAHPKEYHGSGMYNKS